MKQVGLNVAADPFMRTAYIGTKGGMLTIVADDPGPHSSQNEQDTRLFCLQGRVPVFDPASPAEAKELIPALYELSEKYEMNLVLRPTTRVCHSRQNVPLKPVQQLERSAKFEKNPTRWAATPAFLPALHRGLNNKLERLADEPDWQPRMTKGDGSQPRTALIASGIAYSNLVDLLAELDLTGQIDLFQVIMPYPLSNDFCDRIHQHYDRIMILEETYPVIELQLAHPGAFGKQQGQIPREGELTPDLIHQALADFLDLSQPEEETINRRGQRPSLCPGCPHRTAFYAIKQCFPRGIFPSDIGCYTLGMNLGAADTVHCMGACISQGGRLLPGLQTGQGRLPDCRRYHRRFNLLPCRNPGADQRGDSESADHRADPRQRHHGDDRRPTGPAPRFHRLRRNDQGDRHRTAGQGERG